MDFYRTIEADLAALAERGRVRLLRPIRCGADGAAEYDGRSYRNFSGNDYLGVAGDPVLRRKFYESMDGLDDPRLGLSAASSRLLTGNSPEYAGLEEELAAFYGGGRAALCFNSGYHANIGILPALTRKGDLILSDKLNHASIIDALHLSEAEHKRYRHLDYEQLEQLLRSSPHSRKFIVSESLFSMDGDGADLARLVELKEKYGAFLVIDEAHSVGVCGPAGGGMAAAAGLLERIDVVIGTFGKAFGSAGAYAITAPVVREYLINHARSLIFSTGLPPVTVSWSRFVLRMMPQLEPERRRLRELGDALRRAIRGADYATGGNSQIVPLMVGDNHAAMALAEKLRERGFLVFAIRPPTVPPGTARLRFSLSAALSPEDIVHLGESL